MKKSQDSQSSQDVKPTVVTNDSKADLKNTNPAPDAGSISSNDSRKVSREDIELVQNLIERCLQLYMNRDEVVMTLLNRARIDPGFTTLVWQKLEEENADFFREYYIRLKLKKQIILFNQLLEHQCQMMKYSVPLPKVPLAPMQNGLQHPIAANNLPMGYPIMHHPPVAVPGQPHIDPMAYSAGCHVVNGVPAPGNFQPMRINPGNEAMMDASTSDVSPVVPPNHAMSSMPVSPTSVASSAPFPFSTSEISGMGVDTSVLDSAFTSDNGVGTSQDSLRSLAQIPWNFSLSDLSADLSNLGDLGALGSYPGSPFLPSDSDILLDSPDQDVEEFFVDSDSIQGQCQPSDEDKS